MDLRKRVKGLERSIYIGKLIRFIVEKNTNEKLFIYYKGYLYKESKKDLHMVSFIPYLTYPLHLSRMTFKNEVN